MIYDATNTFSVTVYFDAIRLVENTYKIDLKTAHHFTSKPLAVKPPLSAGQKDKKLNDKYLKEGDALLKKGDYVQASEKFWGAAAEVIKAIATRRAVDIRSHGEMYRFITTLSKETEDSELLRYFSLAGALHQNFYENWLMPDMVVDYSKAVKSLVEKLKRLAR